jgi:hypothetical protein
MTLLALEAGDCAVLAQRCNANHGSAVLETHQISLEHTSRIISILARVISIEECVSETLLFGVPSLKVKLRTRLNFLPLAPCDARCDGFVCVLHGSPPFIVPDRTGVGCHAGLMRASLIWPARWIPGIKIRPLSVDALLTEC